MKKLNKHQFENVRLLAMKKTMRHAYYIKPEIKVRLW